MNRRGISALAIVLVVVFCWSVALLADERRGLTVDLNGIVTKTNFVEYLKYQDSIGFNAIQNKLNPDGNPLKESGLKDAAWLMWEKDIAFPTKDENHADWSLPANVVADFLHLEVRAFDMLKFELLQTGTVVANGEVRVFKSCGEPMVAFMHQQAERFATTTMLIKFQVAKRLDVSYLGAETNMLYITERGSLEDSVTYKNIILKIRYKPVKSSAIKQSQKILWKSFMNCIATNIRLTKSALWMSITQTMTYPAPTTIPPASIFVQLTEAIL